MKRIALTTVLMMSSWATVQSADPDWLTFEGSAGPGRGKHIVLISGDEEYRSEESLPMLAKILSVRHGFTCTVLFAIHPETGIVDPNHQNNLPGMETLDEADLVILATRFRTPPAQQMKPFDAYLAAGEPIIGIRTATHAFQGKWESFGLEVLGEEWVAHHGKHKVQGTRAVIEAAHAGHPILRGVHDIFGASDVYAVTHLTDDATILLRGAVTETLHPHSPAVSGEMNDPMMPLAWLRPYQLAGSRQGWAMCTTIGASIDFLSRDLRRLVVNASYFMTGLDVPTAADVEPVDLFRPSFYGFIRDDQHWPQRDLRPQSFGLGQAPEPNDPLGTPRSYWRPSQPVKE